MAKYSKFNIIYLIQKWMDSVAGQTFMNYAYSWGAAIVILGTLFKLTHLPGANLMLFIGMGTEVFVFFIAAFDRPFDKTADGRELATDSQLAAEFEAEEEYSEEKEESQRTIPGSTIIFGGGMVGGGSVSAAQTPETEAQTAAFAGVPAGGVSGGTVVMGAPSPAVTNETAEAMEEVTTTYIDRLNELNDTLLKVAELSKRLTTDSEEMENLNRTLTGISRVYEMQLKSASQQITTQDQINDQTRMLAQQMADLNAIYARMIEAMSVNMK